MPVEISSTTPSVWQLERRFGTGYAIIGREIDGQWVSAPVVLGSFLPVDSYRYDIEHLLAGAVAEREYITIIGSNVTVGRAARMPVVEVVMPDGGTLSELVIARGWAIPDEANLAYHSRRAPMIEALMQARHGHAGMWSDDAWLGQYEGVMSPGLLQQIGPAPAENTRSFSTLSMALAAIVLMLMGLRLWYYSHFVARPQPSDRPFFQRLVNTGFLAFGLRAVYHHADYQPVPAPDDLRRVLEGGPADTGGTADVPPAVAEHKSQQEGA